jgi:hypothetical protein
MSVRAEPSDTGTSGLAPPPVVATIGVHGSASTWMFNIVRELLLGAVGPEKVLVGFAGGLRTVPDDAALRGRHFLLKSHSGPVELDDWLAARQARLILTIRDPRDAALSTAQRFNRPLPDAVRAIVKDNVRIIRLAADGHPLFRYEERFFERPDTIAAVAATLGLTPDRADVDRIFASYTRDAVLALAAALVDPEAESPGGQTADVVDPVTYIHRTHVGDGSDGKWRSLPGTEQAELNRLLRPIVDHFGYPPD